jgi:hypothetical protein
MNTPDLFAIAAEINKAAETEIATDLLPRQTVAFVCDGSGDNGPIKCYAVTLPLSDPA